MCLYDKKFTYICVDQKSVSNVISRQNNWIVRIIIFITKIPQIRKHWEDANQRDTNIHSAFRWYHKSLSKWCNNNRTRSTDLRKQKTTHRHNDSQLELYGQSKCSTKIRASFHNVCVYIGIGHSVVINIMCARRWESTTVVVFTDFSNNLRDARLTRSPLKRARVRGRVSIKFCCRAVATASDRLIGIWLWLRECW